MALENSPSEIEVAELLDFLKRISAYSPMVEVVRRLAFDRDRYQLECERLRDIIRGIASGKSWSPTTLQESIGDL